MLQISSSFMRLRAVNQLRENVKALLFVRKEDQKTLAFAAGIDPSTLSKFLKGDREIQLANLDGVAEFFGIAPYQLFQPGISTLTERRIAQRRTSHERRIGHTQRVMLGVVSQEMDKFHPKGKGSPHVVVASSSPLMDALQREAAEFARRVEAIRARYASPGGQTPVPRKALPAARTSRRSRRGSDDPKSSE